MFDWNGNGERDAFDMAMDLMVLDEMEQKDSQNSLDYDLLGTGYDSLDLEWMDPDERDEILWDNGLDPDDYDF